MLVLGDPRAWGGRCEPLAFRDALELLHNERVVGLRPDAFQQAQDLLSPGERARAAAFRDPVLRNTYAAAHAVLRELLARCLPGQAPQSLSFEPGPFGKPRLSGRAGPCFSISYRPGIAAIAMADRPVGIDVERMRSDVDIAGISRRFFTQPERDHVQDATGADSLARFFEVWTRKEALVKAAGVGMSALPDASTVESMARLQDEAGMDRSFQLRQLPAAAGHALALAAQCAEPNHGAGTP